MNTIEQRIDQSVNLLNQNRLTKHLGTYIPLFPISTAEELKLALVKKFIAEHSDVAPRLIYQAVNEAYALVSLTPQPLLLLPVLAEEKMQSAAAWSARQNSLTGSHPIAFAA